MYAYLYCHRLNSINLYFGYKSFLTKYVKNMRSMYTQLKYTHINKSKLRIQTQISIMRKEVKEVREEEIKEISLLGNFTIIETLRIYNEI